MAIDRILLCTAQVASVHGEAIRTACPGIEIVELRADTDVAARDVERITLAFFSADAYPERAAAFMTACLSAPRLEWLHSYSAGTDHPVFTMLHERGVVVTNSPGTSAVPIAETVMMYLLALTRRLGDWFDAQRDRRWAPHTITELAGSSLAVVGMGPIGCEVVRRAQAFGVSVVGVRRTVRGDEPCPTHPVSELARVVADVDAVVVALPHTDDTRGVMGREVLGAMRPGALLVNVGRGETVDQTALIDLLERGHLGGAALDVFDAEPLAPESPLWALPNVIVTPHSSGASPATGLRAAGVFVDLLGRWAVGAALPGVR